MNHTFLGDWDIRYTVKMLDGTLFEVVYNEWMEDDREKREDREEREEREDKEDREEKKKVSSSSTSSSLLKHVVREADKHGIRLRSHRLKMHLDREMIYLLQEPPRTDWKKICTDEIVEIHIRSDIDRLDALDWFEEHSETEKSFRFLSLDVSFEVREEVYSLWERVASHYRPKTLHIGSNSIQAIRAFGEKGDCVQRLHLSERYDFNARTVEMICETMPHLEELTVTIRIVPESLWGQSLFHRTGLRLVRWRILGYQDIQRSRDMAHKAGWTDWQFQVHVDHVGMVDVVEIEWTRFHLNVYGLVIDP